MREAVLFGSRSAAFCPEKRHFSDSGIQFVKKVHNIIALDIEVTDPTPNPSPLILEGESVSVHAARIRQCHCAHLFLRYYPTPLLRLEGGQGGVEISGIYHHID